MTLISKKKQLKDDLEILSKDFNLVNLKNKELKNNQYEFRIWFGNNIIAAYCFVIKKSAEDIDVSLHQIELKGVSAYKTDKIGKHKVVTKNLSYNSREDLENLLEKHQITKSLPFTFDKGKYIVVEDGRSISIEVKKGNLYDSVLYSNSSTTKNAIKAFQICEAFEDLFDISLGCNEKRALKKINEKLQSYRDLKEEAKLNIGNR